MARQMGTLDLTWDATGRVSHKLTSVVPLNAEQTADILGCSGPMLVAGQLGVMRPIYSLALCDRLFSLIETGQYTVEPINTTLKKASMHFHVGNEIYHTFHPSIGFLANNDSVEQAVRQLCHNYIIHLRQQLVEPFRQAMIENLKMAMLYYLQNGLSKYVNQPGFNPARPVGAVQMLMNEYAHQLYGYWSQGYDFSATSAELLSETKRVYHEVRQHLSL